MPRYRCPFVEIGAELCGRNGDGDGYCKRGRTLQMCVGLVSVVLILERLDGRALPLAQIDLLPVQSTAAVSVWQCKVLHCITAT